MPTVSIVVPSFQQGRYIRATLESILSQDFRDLECIVMDGGSTDETVEVLRSYDDPRLTWVSEPDRGQSHAINKGLERANGDYLSYLNSDDLLRPGAISTIVRFFAEHPETHLVYGDMDHIDEAGRVFHTVIGAPFDLAETLAGHNSVNQSGTFWRRGVMERIGVFDENLHFSMDLEYWVRAALKGETIAYEPGVRSAFRYHDESKTVSRMAGWLREWDLIYERIMSQYERHPDMLKFLRACRVNYSWNYATHFWTLGQVSVVKPLLYRVVLQHPSLKRKVLACFLLIDANLGTSFARVARRIYRSLRGLDKAV